MLLIDDRENPKLINKLIIRLGDSRFNEKGLAKVMRMATSDYRIADMGIEAKEINDLYRSILGIGRNGRTIVNQLRELEESVENPVLVVYGTKFKPYSVNGKSPRNMAIEIARMKQIIKQFKMTFYQRFPKIKYMELLTMDDFVDWLLINHTQINVTNKIKESKIGFSQEEINKDKLDIRVSLLCSIKGVTERQAIDLLEKFGSIPQILHSRRTQKNLMEIKGIGRYKAKNILNLREKYSNGKV